MSSACSLDASQSITFALIAPRLWPLSAASTGRGLPVMSSTTRAPITLACVNPCSNRPCAASSEAPCRSSVKSGWTVPRARSRSHRESRPWLAISFPPRGEAGTGAGAVLRGNEGRTFAARTIGAGTDGCAFASAGKVSWRPSSGATVLATWAQSAASSGESFRPGRLTGT